MTYQNGDRVLAILTNAPKIDSGRHRKVFGFAQPLEGGEQVFISGEAMRTSGLTHGDVGARVVLHVQNSPANGGQLHAYIVERDDSEIGGETPDPIEAEILKRLAVIERRLARILRRVEASDSIEEV